MAAMGHSTGSAMPASSAATASRVSSTSVKVVDGAIALTVDFSAPRANDSLIVAVTLAGPEPTGGRDADLTLTIVPASVASGEHESVGGARDGAFGTMVLSPVRNGGGDFIFRPVLPRDGPYRLTVGLRRVGARTFEPPIEVVHVWDPSQPSRAADATARAGDATTHAGDRTRRTPLLLLGAAAMAVMMLFTLR